MSFCAASCCTCFPKASSAFATSAFSPTGGGPLSCHFAGKLSQWFSRKPNQKPPLPRKPDRFGSVPTVAGPWWSSRGLRRLRSSSVHHPFSPEPPHETTFQLSHSVPLTTARRGVPCLPPNKRSVPNLGPKSRSHHTQTLTQPILASLLPPPVAVPQAPLITPTRLNRHNRLPTGGSLQTAVSDAPRSTHSTCTVLLSGASDTALRFPVFPFADQPEANPQISGADARSAYEKEKNKKQLDKLYSDIVNYISIH